MSAVFFFFIFKREVELKSNNASIFSISPKIKVYAESTERERIWLHRCVFVILMACLKSISRYRNVHQIVPLRYLGTEKHCEFKTFN